MVVAEFYSLSVLLTLSLIAVTTFLLWFVSRRPKGIPPGPTSMVPILGNLVDLDPKDPLETLRKYRARYGDVYSLKMGSKLVIMANGHDTIKDLLVKNADVFSNRPDLFIFKDMLQSRGLASSSGSLWKEHRTFALSTLRHFGFGKRSLEFDIREEIQVCLNVLEETNGESYDMTELIHTNISNVMCALAFSKRFEHTDPRFIAMMEAFGENFKLVGSAGVLNFIPFLKHVPVDFFKVKKALSNVELVRNFLLEFVNEHKDTYDENNIRDYVDAYLKEMKRQENQEDTTFTEEQLLASLIDLFVAATETTATSLLWAILYFLHCPEVQEKMKNEIEEVVGTSRLPNMADRSELAYCDAVITEVQRCGNTAPLSLPHAVDRDIAYKGHTIPKDAVLIPNLDSVMCDPNVFPEPEKFDPSRFLDKDGKLTGQDKVMAFSAGRRVCLGESLARMELFLFLTSLVQRFQFLPENGLPLPSLDYTLGITRSPNAYKCRAILR